VASPIALAKCSFCSLPSSFTRPGIAIAAITSFMNRSSCISFASAGLAASFIPSDISLSLSAICAEATTPEGGVPLGLSSNTPGVWGRSRPHRD
jgi:hypothetical protein